ncbi:hypothetical protein MKEN_00471400 [Mycena kentingensis (nom. inval.)]|nr:hypothetical protein MKEN_00471400 [Mycena kentingensis (nom. inval.)]
MHSTKTNVSIDDFDSLITYPVQSQWTTPDPSRGPGPAEAGWFDGTYHHRTNVTHAQFSFSFTGTDVYIFGGAGPAFGWYKVTIDRTQHYTRSAYVDVTEEPAQTQSTRQHLLFHRSGLRGDKRHTVVVENLGSQKHGEGTDLLVDLVKTTVDIAPAGAILTNITLEETDPSLVYTGEWTENVHNPLFSGGYSRYTNGDGASVSLTFNATAIYIFGDKTDRHGLYTVSLDGAPPETFNGVSGCGGAFAHACEKDNTLVYFAGGQPLAEGEHTITVRNVPGELGAYFDLDAIVLTKSTKYFPAYAIAAGIEARDSGAQKLVDAQGVLWLLLVVGIFSFWQRKFAYSS